MGALAFAEAVTLQADVNILGGSGEQALRVHEYLLDFWRRPNVPTAVLASDPAGRRTKLVWGNKVTALTASMAAVSGPHPQRLRIDEVDLVDLALLNQALGQPMRKRGIDTNVLLSSAHYEPDGTLTEVLKRAKESRGSWGVHEWCWREVIEPHGWLERSEVERQRSVVPSAIWNVQYDLQEPSPEGRAIDPAEVERMFAGPVVESHVGDGEFVYQEFEPPVAGATYATGGDWARVRDYVEIATCRTDVSPKRLVAYQRFRKKATPYILAQFEKQVGRYPGSASHDATGMGILMDDLIKVGEDTRLDGVTLGGGRTGVRTQLFTAYILAVERREYRCPRVDVLYRQHKFVRNDDLWGGGHPPDGFVAMALAHHAADQAPFRLASAADDVSRDGPVGAFQGLLAFARGGNGHGGNGHA